MKMKRMKLPSVSFIICTYNCKKNAERCFSSILAQDYPKKKIEILALDGGSTDGTIKLAKKMRVKVIHNPARYPEGKGRGKWLGFKKARNEIVVFIDSDNKLVEKDWIRKMVMPLISDDEVNFCICRMAIVKSDKAVNRYLSLIGTDPVVAYRSIDSLLALRRLRLIDKGDYYFYKITPKNFIITGGYYFAVKKKTLKKIGGYTQDTDVVYNLAKAGLGGVAIPKGAHVHHLIIDNINNFLKKKIWWAELYFRKQRQGRDFNWIGNNLNEKLRLIFIIFGNLIFLPALFTGAIMAVRDRESAWFFHPFMTFLATYAYLWAYIKSKIIR